MRYLKLLVILFLVSCSSAKQLNGVFVNLEKEAKPEKSTFKISIKEDDKSEIPDKNGNFKIKYPKEGGSLIVLTDEDYVILEKPIPAKADRAIVLVNNFNEMALFLEKGQNFDKEYDVAVEKFKKLPILLDQFPIYPGCENTEIKHYKKCFLKKLNRLVARSFNADLATVLGLSPGSKRINVFFEIDKKGVVNIISVKAPHPRLKKESIRVAKKIPVVKPGIHRNKPVKVKYNLPIVLRVE